MNQPINITPMDDDHNRQARETAHRRVSWPVNLTPATVGYHSQGHALVLGNERDVRRAARVLLDRGLPPPTLLFTDPMTADPVDGADDETLLTDTGSLTSRQLSRSQARSLSIEGYLGHFSASLAGEDGAIDLARALTDREHFDLVLDLSETPALALELPPPGYVALSWASPEREAQLDALAGLVGEFDKPRYFQIDNALCAHSASG